MKGEKESPRWDLNPQSLPPEGNALSIRPHGLVKGWSEGRYMQWVVGSRRLLWEFGEREEVRGTYSLDTFNVGERFMEWKVRRK